MITHQGLLLAVLRKKHPLLLADVSVRTIQNTLRRDLLYKWRCAWKKPIVTRRQMTNRVKFAKEKIDWSTTKWKQVLWSDEATFTVTSNRSGKVRRRPVSRCELVAIVGWPFIGSPLGFWQIFQ